MFSLKEMGQSRTFTEDRSVIKSWISSLFDAWLSFIDAELWVMAIWNWRYYHCRCPSLLRVQVLVVVVFTVVEDVQQELYHCYGSSHHRDVVKPLSSHHPFSVVEETLSKSFFRESLTIAMSLSHPSCSIVVVVVVILVFNNLQVQIHILFLLSSVTISVPSAQTLWFLPLMFIVVAKSLTRSFIISIITSAMYFLRSVIRAGHARSLLRS